MLTPEETSDLAVIATRVLGMDPVQARINAYLAGDLAAVVAISQPIADYVASMLGDVHTDDTTMTGLVSR